MITLIALCLCACSERLTESRLAIDGSNQLPASETAVNVLKWQTARESRNFGYDVYRSTTRDGSFIKVTPHIILGHGTTDVAQSYQFEDQVAACGVYFYYVESVTVDGERESFTPVFQAPIKNAAGDRFESTSACQGSG